MVITEERKIEIWRKGIIDEKYPSEKVRKDACGAFILYEEFGDRNSVFGWEIDHICPAAELIGKGVSEELVDNIINLRPLNWKNNASKGANYPYYTAALQADENNATNIEVKVGKVVNQQIQDQISLFYNLEDHGNGSEL